MNYWLFKSEPDVFSFADLVRKKREPWTGVRNYMARNFMRDDMAVGDRILFYHSSCPEPGVAGVARVASKPYPDPTQYVVGDEYYDAKATAERPIWMLVDVAPVGGFPRYVGLERLRTESALSGLLALRKGNRLSITPVAEAEFRAICAMGGYSVA
jgi:predicted RNA-binding protein with PUA-like domain